MQALQPGLLAILPELSGPLTAESLAHALKNGNAKLASQLLDEIRRLSVLTEVADTVTQDLSLDHQLPRLIELITDALDAERATLFLHDREPDELFSRELFRGAAINALTIVRIFPVKNKSIAPIFGSKSAPMAVRRASSASFKEYSC